MATRIPDRLIWAVEQLSVNSGDEILEIGCGTGVAASLICSRLADGHLTAIDRSESMIDTARRRNQAHVASGRAVFLATGLAEMDVGHKRFNKALAVNVNVFWQQPDDELVILKKVLHPGGEVFLVFQPPVASRAEHSAEACSQFLLRHGFSDITVDFKVLQPVTAVCIRAKLMRV
jgi:ubiquinone/menaquinone biosynthesis C-methylase UbiE